MKLIKAKLRRYRSIEELDEFSIEPDVTCLVGKNESGKTATLQALLKSRAVDTAKFDDSLDYPSHRTRELSNGDAKVVVSVLTYTLDDDDVSVVEAELGTGALASRDIAVTTGYRYGASSTWQVSIDEKAVVTHLRGDMELPAKTTTAADEATKVAELVAALNAMEGPTPASIAVTTKVEAWRGSDPDLKAIDLLQKRRPKFVYFGDYDVMPGKVSIPDLITRRDEEELTRGEEALLALLRISGVEPEDFLEPESHEHLIRSMENASNAISDEVFEYWTQNKNLAVQLQVINSPEPGAAPRSPEVPPFLQIRVRNTRHNVSVPFDERSRGFVWFFSFLAYFSELESQAEQPLVLLLDEPGLSLHATAQNDLLRFIDERLATKHQVIFTTHSPFMVDAHSFHRVRTVVDDEQAGTTISADVLRADGETAFPLHAALGIELTQTLFVGPYVLFVEGASDVVFLNYLSDQLKAAGRAGLDDRWVMVPGGGITKLPAFLTLFGANKLTVAVLTDSSADNDATIQRLRAANKLYAGGIVQVGDALGRDEADVEDLFEPKFYVDLVNAAYQGALAGSPLTVADLPADKRLVRRVERAFADRGINGGKLNHYSAAGALMRKAPGTRRPAKAVLDRSEQLFDKINALLT